MTKILLYFCRNSLFTFCQFSLSFICPEKYKVEQPPQGGCEESNRKLIYVCCETKVPKLEKLAKLAKTAVLLSSRESKVEQIPLRGICEESAMALDSRQKPMAFASPRPAYAKKTRKTLLTGRDRQKRQKTLVTGQGPHLVSGRDAKPH